MSKIVLWVCGVVLGLIVIAFSVHNLGTVAVNLWPLPYTADWPLFLVVLLSIAIGLLAGLFVAWFAGSRTRRLARARRREVKSLERKLETTAPPRRDASVALPARPAR